MNALEFSKRKEKTENTKNKCRKSKSLSVATLRIEKILLRSKSIFSCFDGGHTYTPC